MRRSRVRERDERLLQPPPLEAGARGDSRPSKVDDVIGGAPPAGLAPGNEPQRTGEHANPLRLGARQGIRSAVDRVEQPGEQLIALRGRRLGSNHEPHAANRVGDGSGTGPVPFGSSCDHRARGIHERRGQRKLGDLGQGEIHASPSGATTSVVLTLSRYLRLP